MNKSRNIMKEVIVTLYIIIIINLPISFANRAIYGSFNVFGYPNRVSFHGYRYDNNGEIMVLTGDNKPKYEVSGIIDRFTGKRIYSNEIDFMGNGKTVCLYLDGNRYLILRSGGCCAYSKTLNGFNIIFSNDDKLNDNIEKYKEVI